MRKLTVLFVSLFFVLFSLNCLAQGAAATAQKSQVPQTNTSDVKAPQQAANPSEPVQTEASASPSSEITIDDASIATSIESLSPVGAATEFPKETAKLYCYSKVKGAEGETSIKHIWYHNDQMTSEVELPIKAKSWRTYSTKTINPSLTGSWRVDIASMDGSVLKSLNFEIK